jgi:hypothetical protein
MSPPENAAWNAPIEVRGPASRLGETIQKFSSVALAQTRTMLEEPAGRRKRFAAHQAIELNRPMFRKLGGQLNLS